MFTPDAVDVRILQALIEDPRLTVSELAERAGVVRNTAQARLDRLHREGVLGRNDRGVELRELGYVVSAVVAIQLRHAEIEQACAALEDNPSVLLVEEVAGSTGDLLVRVACRSTDDLQAVVHSLLSTPGVVSTTTQVVLKTRVPFRVGPLLDRLSSAPSAAT
ncbi:MAG: transcriptional regulator [Frankiales bacterium]|nr:transcriptional regulator [Frankiales bacterium]